MTEKLYLNLSIYCPYKCGSSCNTENGLRINPVVIMKIAIKSDKYVGLLGWSDNSSG
jgi:hypothetical protein